MSAFSARHFSKTAFRSIIAAPAALLFAASAAANLPDYNLLDEILVQNVQRGFVDYDGFQADPRFGDIILHIGAADVADFAAPDEQLAFLINAYNALAIKGILDGHSVASRRDRQRFFRRQQFQVAGEDLSLEELERDRIIPLGDPRIHFALACASLSCPRLWNRAYQPGALNEQLDNAARRFTNDPVRNHFDPERRIALLSAVFRAHAKDFETAGGSLQGYLAQFVENPAVAEILRNEGFDLRYRGSDWILNGHFSGPAE